ncbi:hypothetical protein Tco_1220879 [Tanacetum coccineum]
MPNDEERRNLSPNSEGVKSANIEDAQDIDNSECGESLTHPQEDDHQNIVDTQPVRRSSRPFNFPRNFNDFIVGSKVRHGLEKYVRVLGAILKR